MKYNIAILLLTALPCLNCSKDGGGDGFFIPILENQWYNRDNPDDFFNISKAADPNSNSSTFGGTEDSTDGNGNTLATYNFTGSFTNHNIQFTYEAGSGFKNGKTYSGTINDASTEITVHNADLGNLVLKKP